MSAIRLRVVALLVGLAIVLPSPAFARAHYFCRMMDRVMDAPCCAADRNTDQLGLWQQGRRREEARAPDCCVRVEASRGAIASSPRLSMPVVPSAALMTILEGWSFTPAPVTAARARLEQARAPPLLGPPLFLAHCSLLI